MRAFRTFPRFWAFVCALAFLPWMQVAMASPVDVPASCCADMPGMATLPAGMAAQHIQIAAHDGVQVQRAFCHAACDNLNASISVSQAKVPVAQHVALIERVALMLQTRPKPPARQSLRIESPPLSRPPFLAARLQV